MEYSRLYADNVIFALVLFLIVILLFDTSLVRLTELIRLPSSSHFSTILFISIVISYGIGQFLVLGYVRNKGKEIRIHGNLYLRYIDVLMKAVQYVFGCNMCTSQPPNTNNRSLHDRYAGAIECS